MENQFQFLLRCAFGVCPCRWIENWAQIAIVLFMDFYLYMKISFLSSWR